MPDYTCFHIATVTPDWKSDDGKGFPHPIQHRPVALCFIRIMEDGRAFVYTDGLNELIEEHERGLVQEFVKKLPTNYETLVGTTVRRFSLPVMYYRALHYGLPTKQISDPITGAKPIDISVLGDNERSTPALYQLGQLVGFAKRPWLDIAKAWQDGHAQLIIDRLEVDTMLIACVFLRMQFCRGDLSANQYQTHALSILNIFKERTEFSSGFLQRSDVKQFLQVGK